MNSLNKKVISGDFYELLQNNFITLTIILHLKYRFELAAQFSFFL